VSGLATISVGINVFFINPNSQVVNDCCDSRWEGLVGIAGIAGWSRLGVCPAGGRGGDRTGDSGNGFSQCE
jgi:hypothetical protein